MEDINKKLFDLAPGSTIKLIVSEENEAEPTIYQGCCTVFHGQKDNCDDYIILKDAVDLSNDEPIIQPLLINISEIILVEVIPILENSNTDDDDLQEDDVPEITLETVMIDGRQPLELLMTALEEVDTIACSFEGKDIGRFGVVTWIILVAKNTLLPLNINQLTRQLGGEVLWQKLDRHIFSNSKLVKVFFDCRGPADYLFHQHGINLKNVFDSQVADVYVQKKTTGLIPSKHTPLSECLQLHCTVSFADVKILKEYENSIHYYRSSWLDQPMPSTSILKIGALKVKHLVALRQSLLQKIMAKYTATVSNHLDHWLQTAASLNSSCDLNN